MKNLLHQKNVKLKNKGEIMIFYHGSNKLIKNSILLSNYREDNLIYLTDSYCMAVFYSGCGFRSWYWNDKTNKLIIIERCKDMLKKLYWNKKSYIYETENIDDYEELLTKNGKKCFVIKNRNVKIKRIETIKNVYEKIMELYNQGKLEIWFWKDMSKSQKIKYKKQMKIIFNPDVLKKEKEMSIQTYNDMVNCFPYLLDN